MKPVKENISRGLQKFYTAFYSYRCLWGWLWAMSLCGIIDIVSASDYGLRSIFGICYLITVSAFKASVVLCLLMPMLKSKWLIGKVIGWCIVIVLSILSLTNAVAIAFYQLPLSRTLFRTFLETNLREASEFTGELAHNLASLLSSPSLYAGLIVIIGIGVIIKKVRQTVWQLLVAGVSIIGFIMFAYYCGLNAYGRTAHSTLFRTARYAYDVYQSQLLFRRMAKSLPPLPYAESVESRHSAATVIVVLGESATRTHLSLYGYSLPTSPRMGAMRDSLFVFSDAISSAPSTLENIDRILTLKRDNEVCENPFVYPRLIDIFNHAGYKTFWLSNQERTGEMSNNSSIFSLEAAVTDYVGIDNSEDNMLNYYDERLLPKVHKALVDTTPNKLIFAHLMGSHVKYSERYPNTHARFTADDEISLHGAKRPWLTRDGAAVIAHYDNSIRYTDSVLCAVIHDVALQTVPAAFVYFSDHGENVYDEGNRTGRGVKYVKVPFVIYLNAAYRKANPEIVNQLERAKRQPISTANFVHSLMTLTGTSYKLFDPTIDFLSSGFKPRVRYVNDAPWPYDHRK